MMKRGNFNPEDLVRVPEPISPCVLKSGSTIMELETTEGDNGLCSWVDENGKINRLLIPLACLYKCEKFK